MYKDIVQELILSFLTYMYVFSGYETLDLVWETMDVPFLKNVIMIKRNIS